MHQKTQNGALLDSHPQFPHVPFRHPLTVNQISITDQISLGLAILPFFAQNPSSRSISNMISVGSSSSDGFGSRSAPSAEIPCQTFDGRPLSLPSRSTQWPNRSRASINFATPRRVAFHIPSSLTIPIPTVPTRACVFDDISSGTLKKPSCQVPRRGNGSLIIPSRDRDGMSNDR